MLDEHCELSIILHYSIKYLRSIQLEGQSHEISMVLLPKLCPQTGFKSVRSSIKIYELSNRVLSSSILCNDKLDIFKNNF